MRAACGGLTHCATESPSRPDLAALWAHALCAGQSQSHSRLGGKLSPPAEWMTVSASSAIVHGGNTSKQERLLDLEAGDNVALSDEGRVFDYLASTASGRCEALRRVRLRSLPADVVVVAID
jgi:hypothetical protein